MKKPLITIIVLVALGYVLFLNIDNLNIKGNYSTSTPSGSVSLPDFSNSLNIPKLNLKDSIVGGGAWQAFDEYRKAAHNHNLEEIKRLSYQLSETCKNKETESDCFAIMDGLYEATKDFKITDFTNTIFDDKQIISYTDYHKEAREEGSTEDRFGRTLIYFIKSSTGSPLILSIRFCSTNDLKVPDDCVEPDPAKRDLDNDGWWDSLQNIFYVKP